MLLNRRFHTVLLFLVGLGLLPITATGQAPLPINGPTDRSISSSAVNFSVPSTVGYTYAVSINGKPVPTDINHSVSQPDYHELLVSRTNATTLEVTNRLVRFIIRASDRGDTETGSPRWVPYPTIPSATAELAGAHIDLLAPAAYPQGLEIPVIAWIRNSQNGVVRANGQLAASGHPSITMRRGVGSGLLAANHPAGVLNCNKLWNEHSRISITGRLLIPAGSSLTIEEGVVVRLNSGVNITNLGRLSISGTTRRPVVFAPVTRAQPWGGFFLTAATSLL